MEGLLDSVGGDVRSLQMFDPMGNNCRSIKNSQVRLYNVNLAINHRTLISINILAQDDDSFTTYKIMHGVQSSPPTSAFHYLTS